MHASLLTESDNLGAVSQAGATKAKVPYMYVRSFQRGTGSLLSLVKWAGVRQGELVFTSLSSLWAAPRYMLMLEA